MRKTGITAWAMVAALLGLSGSLYALDVADVTREWTAEGKNLAAERIKLPAHDEMIRIPAGEFLQVRRKEAPHEQGGGRRGVLDRGLGEDVGSEQPGDRHGGKHNQTSRQ